MSEPIDKFLARVRASAHLGEIEVKRAPRGTGRLRGAVKRALDLTPEQLMVLLDLAEERAALITVAGEPYALWSEGFMRGLKPDDVKHTVSEDSCSCKGHQFHGTECKHMRAYKRWFRTQ